jgi:antitoxin ParD1/3/4
MNISLTPELEQLVLDKVKSGMYHSASEVMRDALRLLKERDQLQALKLQELRREVQKGLDQIERGEVVDADDVFRELRERNKKFKQQKKR